MNFLTSITVADVTDIAIVATLFYAGLLWFKKTKAFLVVVGIVILGVVYAMARFLNLFLTTSILQSFFTVFLIAVIVIFQEELRQFFERVALWGLGHRPRPEAPRLVEVLVRTADDLARARVGALIVLAGLDPIERHIEGGTELGGLPSEPLLKSIFDVHTPAHDGAAIIRDGRVERFAVYLPLSKDLDKTAGRGTRHAAAIGLSERCDALAIVVSEERGRVSVVRDGVLKTLDDVAELGRIASEYLKEKFPLRQARKAKGIFTQNLREKIIAAALAVALWGIFAATSGVVQRDFLVPVEYSNIPAEMGIERVIPRELTVTLTGDERLFRIFSPEDIKATVDLSMAREGKQRISIRPGAISRVPRNFRINSIRPEEIDITLKRAEK